ncbi:MAG TPA: SMC-Scp complex subunit ScpB, partial [candidate division Zixibacteria bacterium]
KAVLDELSDDKIKGLVEALNRKYEENNQSFTIREIAEGYQMYTRPEFAPWINQLYSLKKAQRLSHAGLETLAIIAYRQPVVKSTIDQIRGVDSGGVIHTLLERKFITILGREESAGRPLIYGTTEEFLIYFGLKDLKDLPRIEELESLLQAKEKKENSIFSTGEKEERIKELNLEGSLAINLPSKGIKEEL